MSTWRGISCPGIWPSIPPGVSGKVFLDEAHIKSADCVKRSASPQWRTSCNLLGAWVDERTAHPWAESPSCLVAWSRDPGFSASCVAPVSLQLAGPLLASGLAGSWPWVRPLFCLDMPSRLPEPHGCRALQRKKGRRDRASHTPHRSAWACPDVCSRPWVPALPAMLGSCAVQG